MTFKMWYEEVEKKSYQDLSPQGKNALECTFFDYLRKAYKDEAADLRSKDEQNPSVSPGVAATA